MRPLSFLVVLAGLLMAGSLAAQTPPAAPAAPAVLPAAPPAPAIEAENVWNLDLSTGGRVSIQLRPDVAPAHVERIKALSRQGFYKGGLPPRDEGFMPRAAIRRTALGSPCPTSKPRPTG